MPGYDPQSRRQRPTEAAIDSLLDAAPGNGSTPPGGDREPADREPAEVIDLAEPSGPLPSAPTVTPAPPPTDEVLVGLSVAGAALALLGAAWVWRRRQLRRRRG